MKRQFITVLMAGLLLLLWGQPLYSGNKKLAQTGMKFLNISPDARASALSGATTALFMNNSAALFYNPATMAGFKGSLNVSFGRVQWIADINHLYGSAAYQPGGGQYGVIGLTFLSVDYGSLKGTIRAENDQGFLDVGQFQPNAFAFGLGYAKNLSNKFAVGGHVKYVNQDLVGGSVDFVNDQVADSKNLEANVLAFDFGIVYKTGFKRLTFGMNVRNFSEEIEFVQESLQLPLTFEMGISFDLVDLMTLNPEQHAIMLSMDAVHPRDYAEQLDIGLEYRFMNAYSLRMGYTSPTDEQGISLGAGFKQKIAGTGFNLDYAYTPFGVFKEVHRFSLQFTL